MLRFKMLALFVGMVIIAAGTTTAVGGGWGCATTEQAGMQKASYETALEKSEKSGLPILLKIGTEWCSYCKKFDEATKEHAALKASLAKNVVLVPVDAEKGEGVNIAKLYRASNYPTFILANSEGEVMDRWMSYWDPDHFVKTLEKAVVEPVTVADRKKRYQEEPTELDAQKLGDLSRYEGLYAEAAAYYRRADALNPQSENNYELEVLGSMSAGAYHQVFTTDQVHKQAKMVLASNKTTDLHAMKVAGVMGKVAKTNGDIAHVLPYIKEAVERTEGSADAKVQKARTKMMPDYALHIQKDEKKAIEYKRDSMPEGWTENGVQLNNFAWWCFENEINLDEAEGMARKGVELCKSGIDKANVLDTLAEICNLKGDCGDALELIKLAIAEAPENEYFQKQLVRFEELLAAQQN